MYDHFLIFFWYSHVQIISKYLYFLHIFIKLARKKVFHAFQSKLQDDFFLVYGSLKSKFALNRAHAEKYNSFLIFFYFFYTILITRVEIPLTRLWPERTKSLYDPNFYLQKSLSTVESTYSHLGYSHNPHIIRYLKKFLVSTLNTLKNFSYSHTSFIISHCL